MKFKIQTHNIARALRRAGYRHQHDNSFVRVLDASGYPRFHIYVNNDAVSIHLDQKKPVYETAHDHAAEYDGEVIESEVKRIIDLN